MKRTKTNKIKPKKITKKPKTKKPKRIRKILKKNMTSLILFMLVLIIVLATIFVVSVFMPTTFKDAYGNRLAGIEDNIISEARITELTEFLTASELTETATVRISGKIIEVNLGLALEKTSTQGKDLANSFLGELEETEKEFYDVQVFITTAGEESKTVIGYKTPAVDKLSWTNN